MKRAGIELGLADAGQTRNLLNAFSRVPER
jgi:hypothetical protein